jgi:hypothetical protein
VTTKGNLVRDILYPKPNKFKFYQDSLKFIFSMGLLAVIGFFCTLPFMIKHDQALKRRCGTIQLLRNSALTD